MDPMQEMRELFFLECEELLGNLERGLLLFKDQGFESENVNAIFRAVHSIKGGAGAFGFSDLVSFAHTFENVLDLVRAGTLNASPADIDLFLRCADELSDLVKAAFEGAEPGPACASLKEELAALSGPAAVPAGDGQTDGAEDDGFMPLALDLGGLDDAPEAEAEAEAEPIGYTIDFTPFAALYANGSEPLALFRELERLGPLTAELFDDDVEPLGAKEVPPALTWRLTLQAAVPPDAVEEIFEFVEGECALAITPMMGDQETDRPAPAAQEDAFGDASPSPEPAAASFPFPASPPDESAADAARPGEAQAKPAISPTVRVNLDRIDRLINLVGELVINQAMIAQCIEASGLQSDTTVSSGLDELQQLTREIQESVMTIRAQPVSGLFQRMSRIVREAGQATGKSVRLRINGEATEVDKTVIEQLTDPLTHMIRNAVDHGLETPEQRRAAGKPEEGVVTLSASHRSGRVVIDVTDDGAGIDREAVKKRAIDKGLISPADQISDAEIDNILFMPGFSTAAAVTDLSGRGVGMDVVKRAITSLGGKVSISSEPGRGTSFSVSLPLTLAVLDGMVVELSGERVVLPLTAILETLSVKKNELHRLEGGSCAILVRGEFLPLIDVASILGFSSDDADDRQVIAIVVETDEGGKAALLVDAIVEQRQVVVKGLDEVYAGLDAIAAATILGDGRVSLILDVDAILLDRLQPPTFKKVA